LNPFFTYNDARNIYGGNPDLDPEFTDSYELGHIKYWGSASFSSSIYYRHTEGVVERIRTVNDEGITRTRPVNLSTQDAYGFEFNFSVEPTKWWRLSGDMNFYRAITEGLYEGITYDADTYTMNGRFTSRTTIKKEVDIQIRGNYRAPRQTTQGSSRAYIFFDLGANKDILKGKGTITFSIRDILNSRKWRYTSFGEDFYSEGDFQWRARQFTLSLNYRLNQKKQRGNRGQRGERGGGDDMGF
jgi:outer membrane receptor protein involved in Fe transport